MPERQIPMKYNEHHHHSHVLSVELHPSESMGWMDCGKERKTKINDECFLSSRLELELEEICIFNIFNECGMCSQA
jgi:hypothetical protein